MSRDLEINPCFGAKYWPPGRPIPAHNPSGHRRASPVVRPPCLPEASLVVREPERRGDRREEQRRPDDHRRGDGDAVVRNRPADGETLHHDRDPGHPEKPALEPR